jgi:hypothetical protein
VVVGGGGWVARREGRRRVGRGRVGRRASARPAGPRWPPGGVPAAPPAAAPAAQLRRGARAAAHLEHVVRLLAQVARGALAGAPHALTHLAAVVVRAQVAPPRALPGVRERAACGPGGGWLGQGRGCGGAAAGLRQGCGGLRRRAAAPRGARAAPRWEPGARRGAPQGRRTAGRTTRSSHGRSYACTTAPYRRGGEGGGPGARA